MKRIGLIWRTVWHLTARQLLHQMLIRLRSRARLRFAGTTPVGHFLVVPDADKLVSYASGTFMFLHQSLHMTVIDWNYANHGKLWTYNLNYFDFLNQTGLSLDDGLLFVRDFIAQTDSLKDGLEPYPTSLRISNWVQFLSRNQIQDEVINRYLYAQTRLLRRRLEYHLAGNHMLENGFALLTAALYFRHDGWLREATKLVRAELSTQILTDGGHDERSPMYHQFLLDRLLDVLLAVKHDTWHNDPALTFFLEEKAARMLGWLNIITFQNGDVPMMNDATPGIAPTTAQLRAKVMRVGLVSSPCSVRSALRFSQTTETAALDDTGYRKFTFPCYELVADVGQIGPDHQPGHGHADTFSFMLHVDNQPVIVDSGTSTYDIGPRRVWERSTAAHNTVDVMGVNSSEVWAGFRVGRRARVMVLADTPTRLTACHDGYRHLGIIHERAWSVDPMHICITDRLTEQTSKTTRNLTGIARLHFHPDVAVSLAGIGIEAGAMRVTFASESAPKLHLTTYDMADSFNRLRPAQCVEITFTNQLETTLIPNR